VKKVILAAAAALALAAASLPAQAAPVAVRDGLHSSSVLDAQARMHGHRHHWRGHRGWHGHRWHRRHHGMRHGWHHGPRHHRHWR
jgi:hypothetical protein